MNKTFLSFPNSIKKKWYIMDAKNKTLGRLSTEIVYLLTGKYKVEYCSSMDFGDYVIIINAEQVRVTGKKEKQKMYKHHSGTPGGLKIESLKNLRVRIPTRILEKSVKGMLPKGYLGRKMYKRLKVFSSSQHSHNAQKPKVFNQSF